jgi:hypothetical protein
MIKMKISDDLWPDIYRISNEVYKGKLSMAEGVDSLSSGNRMNKNSIRDYIYDFGYMMKGDKFTRTLNAPSMEYILERVYSDYGTAKLVTVLSSLKKHIEYYEGRGKGRLFKMRKIHEKFSAKFRTPVLISLIEQLTKNICTLEYYISEGDESEKLAATGYVVRGICFVAYSIKEELRFAPSRFIGYVDNSLESHIPSETDGRETNNAISGILGAEPSLNPVLEGKFLEYCHKLGLQPKVKGSFGVDRKYWELVLEEDFKENEALVGGFPEGKIIERLHRFRERDSRVIQIAKDNFKKKYGRIFCQICEIDFEEKYGQIGSDFIEAHHTMPVGKMPPDYKTKPDEIAMLCPNCHRMIHKRRPWLEMPDLKKLLK